MQDDMPEQLEGKELRYMPPSDVRSTALHVTNHGDSRYSLLDTAMTFHEVAEGLRHYLGMDGSTRPESFAGYYSGHAITPEQFDKAASDNLNHISDAGVYDVNLDAGTFCVLRDGQSWDRYRVGDVCYEAWQASLEGNPDAQEERFLAEIGNKEVSQIPAPVFDHAVFVPEKELHIAAFHTREDGRDAWFSLPGPMQSVFTATALREYLLRRQNHQAGAFSTFFREARAMTRNDYEWYTANRMGRGDIAAKVYDLDLDGGMFSELHRDGWKSYPVDAVCTAALQASNLTQLSPIPESQRFLDRIAGHEVPRKDLEIYIRGDRRLDPGEISFSDSIEQIDMLLNFYMDVCFNADAVLGTYIGTSENYDFINLYANYDLERGTLCDDLDVTLWRGDRECVSMHYRLSTEEKERILPKLAEYCQRDTGMTLDAWREQYYAECLDEQGAGPTEEDGSAVQKDGADLFRTIAVTLHEYKLEALEKQLEELGTDVEEWLQDQLIQLYSDMVPYEQQKEIRERIDAAQAAPPQEPEAPWEQKM